MKSSLPLALGSTALLAVLIAYLTLSAGDLGTLAPGSDKLHHALAFAALAFPIAALQPRWTLPAMLVFAAFGGAIELIQPYVGRSRDVMDWLADVIGLGLGASLGLGFGQGLAWLQQRRLRS